MQKTFQHLRYLLPAVAVFLLLAGCGESGEQSPEARQSSVAAPELQGARVITPTADSGDRIVSGLPTGVKLEWSRVDDPAVDGYFVYRDTQTIPDSARGDAGLRRNNDEQVEQPGSGPVTHEDTEFNNGGPEIGTTYHYRVSTVDVEGVEGQLSNEITVTVSEHSVADISPTTATCGTEITINGDNFGQPVPEEDEVLFTDPSGETPGISATINNWQQEQILVDVPPGAGAGPVSVVIAGTVADSNNDFTPESPLLSGTSGSASKPGDVAAIQGDNLTPNSDLELRISPDLSFAPSDSEIQSWSDTQIELELPSGMNGDGELTVLNNSAAQGDPCRESNTVDFLVQPTLTSLSNSETFPGEELTINGERLGTSRDGRTVSVGGVDATNYLNWSDTEVTIEVPDGIPDSGQVEIDNNGVVSNGLSYTKADPLTLSIENFSDRQVLEEPTEISFSFSGGPGTLNLIADGSEMETVDQPDPQQDTSFTLDPADFSHKGYTVTVQVVRRGLEVGESRTVFFRVLPGDFNGDDQVGQSDFDTLAGLLGTEQGDSGYSPLIDTNGDGVIDERDAQTASVNIGATRGNQSQ